MKLREIDRQQAQPGQAAIVLYLDPALFWFRGHFADRPLLPGVAQLDWAMRYAAALLAPGFRFHSIRKVKFQAPLLPDNTVTLMLHWQEENQILTFSYLRHEGDARHTASSGKIYLCR